MIKDNTHLLETYNFDLPDNLIAQKPLENREEANLLHVDKEGNLKDLKVLNIIDLLNKGDLLILNNTKVIKARLKGVKGEAKILVTLHYQVNEHQWLSFIKNSKRLKEGSEIKFTEDFKAVVIEKKEDGETLIEFYYKSEKITRETLFMLLDKHGYIPLPPYIKRDDINTSKDLEDYQTVFAEKEGAVAAPTASFHITEEALEKIKQKGIAVKFVTLHVGAGTFLGVKSENILDHKMHKEYAEVSLDTTRAIEQTQLSGGSVVALGTTPLRVLEYLAETGGIREFCGEIDLFIYPGFKFKVVDKLITNFHLPKSTLFMLVCAFCSIKTMKNAYHHAINSEYRFFSYGDASFLTRNSKNEN